jgi:hypothetical protein
MRRGAFDEGLQPRRARFTRERLLEQRGRWHDHPRIERRVPVDDGAAGVVDHLFFEGFFSIRDRPVGKALDEVH